MTVGHSGHMRAHAGAAGQPAHRVRHAGRAAGAARRVAGPGAPVGPAPLPCSPAHLYLVQEYDMVLQEGSAPHHMHSSAPECQLRWLCAWHVIPSPGLRAPQTAAGSVLGRLVIALAAARGVRTANLVRRAEQREELLALGRAPAAQRSCAHLLGLGLGLLLPGRQSMAGLPPGLTTRCATAHHFSSARLDLHD